MALQDRCLCRWTQGIQIWMGLIWLKECLDLLRYALEKNSSNSSKLDRITSLPSRFRPSKVIRFVPLSLNNKVWGVTIRNPPRNMNMSELNIMFTTGVGIRVQESRGLLNIIVALPDNYHEVHAVGLLLPNVFTSSVFSVNSTAMIIDIMTLSNKTRNGRFLPYSVIQRPVLIGKRKITPSSTVVLLIIGQLVFWERSTETHVTRLQHLTATLSPRFIHRRKKTLGNYITTSERSVSAFWLLNVCG